MTVLDVYTKYQIPPWLQLHQLRVAAVGSMAVDAYQGAATKECIVKACLLHDMGSIVKFDFNDRGSLPDLCPSEDVPYWIGVQNEFHQRYGKEEHPATDAVLAEIGGLDDIRAMIRLTGFAHMKELMAAQNTDILIVQYADMRTAPYGILSLEERIRDVQVRYAERLRAAGRFEAFDEYLATALEIEARLFKDASIRPEDINDVAAAPLIEELKKYTIS